MLDLNLAICPGLCLYVRIFGAFVWWGHQFLRLQRKFPKNKGKLTVRPFMLSFTEMLHFYCFLRRQPCWLHLTPCGHMTTYRPYGYMASNVVLCKRKNGWPRQTKAPKILNILLVAPDIYIDTAMDKFKFNTFWNLKSISLKFSKLIDDFHPCLILCTVPRKWYFILLNYSQLIHAMIDD